MHFRSLEAKAFNWCRSTAHMICVLCHHFRICLCHCREIGAQASNQFYPHTHRQKKPSHCQWCWIRFIMHYFRRYFVENPNSIDTYTWLFAILAHFKVNCKTNFETHLYAWSFWPENTNRHFDWENALLNGILLCSKAITRNTQKSPQQLF